nr:PREDICTED: cyclin-dependent kinase 4 inhibitor C [Opisthocomus hoazin]
MAEPSGNELASAAAKGDLVQLTNLLQKNVNVNAQNGFGRTALQVGIQRGKEMFHHWLLLLSPFRAVGEDRPLRSGQRAARTLGEEGNLALHWAAREGHARVVEVLLGCAGCKVGHQNKRGATAYDLAKLYKRAAVVKLLEGSSSFPAAAD